MQILIEYMIPIVLLAVAFIVVMGLWNMVKGGSANKSQKLMRLRIIMQAVAIIFLMLLVYLKSGT